MVLQRDAEPLLQAGDHRLGRRRRRIPGLSGAFDSETFLFSPGLPRPRQKQQTHKRKQERTPRETKQTLRGLLCLITGVVLVVLGPEVVDVLAASLIV